MSITATTFVLRHLMPMLLAATALSASPLDLYAPWRWSHLGVDEDLPTETALTVGEATDGTLWVGTSAGLLWFDGYHFVRPPGSDADHTVHLLWMLADGQVAFTIDGELHSGDRNGFAVHPLDFEIISAAVDAEGVQYLLSRDTRLYALGDGEPLEVPLPEGVASNEILRVVSAGESLWLRTSNALYRKQGVDWIREVSGYEIDNVTVRADGRRYGAIRLPIDQRGLWSWRHGEEPARLTAGAADLVKHVAAAPDGRIIVITESGATELYDGTAWISVDPLPPQMRGVRHAEFRRNGDLILATSRGVRIHRQADPLWRQWYTPGGGARNRVDEILPLDNGDVWLGTDAGVEVRHADGTISWFDEIEGQEIRVVTGLAEDREGGIWVSSGAAWDGAFRFFAGRWQFYGYEDGLQASRIHRIHRDDDGRLWFLGLNASTGVFRGLPASVVTYVDERFEVYAVDPELAQGRVHSLAWGADGSLWFSGARGISRLLDGDWTHWNTDTGLRYGAVFTLAADAGGGVFFGDMNNGLGRVTADGTVGYLNASDGLVDDEIWDLEVDDNGTLWIATRGGLSSYRDGMWTSFGTGTGLEALELWPVATTKSDVLVGSAGKGTFLLDLSAQGHSHPKVRFSPTIASDDRVLVRWQPLSFESVIPSERIQTRTRVDSGAWSSWSTRRELELSNLSSGEHVVDVQAASITGLFREAAYAVHFNVAPSLYSRPRFYLPVGLSGLAVILLSIAFVSRRRRDALALFESESRYRSFFQQAPISLWEQDYSEVKAYLEGLNLPDEAALRAHLTPRVVFECTGRIRILDVNEATLELFECEDLTTLSRQLQQIFRREAYAALTEGMITLHNGQTRFAHETVAYSLKGTRRHVILSFAVVPGSTVAYSRVLVSVLDVSAQQQAAEEMRAAAVASEEANLAKSAFLANTSHEIRTPINAVMGMAQALQDEDLPARAVDQVETILRASESLSEIIDDLLDLSKIEAGQLELTSLPYNPVEVLDGALSTLASRAADKHIGLTTVVDPSTPREVEGDRVRLRQILLNLLGNAVKFTEKGTVDVHIRAESIDDAVALHFEVHDTGIGIPAGRLDSIFEPFAQADSSVTRTYGGTGLGLSISKRLVEMMGGRITVHSEPAVGSTFRFHVLVKPGSGRAQPAVAVDEADVAPMRILLVEDNALNRKVAHALLRKDQHDIVEAENGVVAVDLFRQGPAFDLVLMDLQMPQMDGITATERIRAYELEADLERTPIIALTANAMQGDRDRCLQVGMDDFISKPVRKEDLRAALARIQPHDRSVEPPIPADGSATDLPVLDTVPLEELRELETSGDFSIAEFVELFQSTTPECLQRARQARETGDLPTLHREVHTLKGSAREVGAQVLAARAEFWEQQLKAGEASGIDGGLDELETLLDEANAALRSWAATGDSG